MYTSDRMPLSVLINFYVNRFIQLPATENDKYVAEEPMVDARCLEDLKTINPLQAVK
mgnify:CR=1 FL=1